MVQQFTALITLWCMTNYDLCANHMNEISDQAMQATNNYTTPFMLQLYKEISTSGQAKNMLISPISVVSLLGMISAGAQGATDEEITHLLGWHTLDEVAAYSGMSRTTKTINSYNDTKGVNVFLGNAIFIAQNYKILPRFQKVMKDHFGVHNLIAVDFSHPYAREAVNQFVAQKTKGIIKESIPPNSIGPGTKLVFCNALLFSATWTNQFAEEFTTIQDFTIGNGESVRASIMYQTDSFNYGNVEQIGAEVVELKYQSLNTSMYILLPNMDDGGDPIKALNAMKRKISDNPYIVTKMDNYLTQKSVILSLPKFELKTDYDLKKSLPSLGVHKVFNEYEADLSGITGKKDGLFLSNVLHKAQIKVDEKGSVGAASTSGVASSRNGRSKNFNANRPFAFYICDKNTNAVMFFGQLVNPNQ